MRLTTRRASHARPAELSFLPYSPLPFCLPRPSSAMDTPLSEEAVRDAYFLGQHHDQTLTFFLAKYQVPPDAQHRPIHCRHQFPNPVRPARRRLQPAHQELQRPASRTRPPPPPRQSSVSASRFSFTETYGALNPTPYRLQLRRRPTPPRFLPRLPRRPLPTVQLPPARTNDRAPSHHSPTLIREKLKPLPVYPRRPRSLFLRQQLTAPPTPTPAPTATSTPLAGSSGCVRRRRCRFRRRLRRSHHHRRPARLRPLRPLPTPLTALRAALKTSAPHSYPFSSQPCRRPFRPSLSLKLLSPRFSTTSTTIRIVTNIYLTFDI